MFKGLLDIIKYELFKNWKLMIGSAFVVYGLKIIFVLSNSSDPGEAAGFGLLISLWVFGFLVIFLFSQAITAEFQNNTMPFFLTRTIPRRNILLGKIIGNVIVLIGISILISASITPGLVADLDWYQECLSFCFTVGWPILSMIIFVSMFTVFVSIYCSTTIKAMIITTIALIILFIAQGAFLGFEAYYLIHLIFSVVFFIGSIRMFSRGDIYSFRHLTRKSAPVVIFGAVICVIFLMGMTSYWDGNNTFGPEDRIDSVFSGKFNGKTWVNRSKKLENMSGPSMGENGITCKDKEGKWEQYGIRHMSVMSISPDSSAMLVKETRNFINLYARGHCTLYVVDSKGEKHQLGMYSPSLTKKDVNWGPNNELLIVNPPSRRYRRSDRPFKSLVMFYNKGKINCLGFISIFELSRMFIMENGNLMVNGCFDPDSRNYQWKVFDFSVQKKLTCAMYRNHSLEGKLVKELNGHKFVKVEKKGRKVITSLNERYYLADLSNINSDKIEILELPEFKNKTISLTETGWSCFWSEQFQKEDKLFYKLYSVRMVEGKIVKNEYLLAEKAIYKGSWNSSGDRVIFRSAKETGTYKELDPEKAFENPVLSKKVKGLGKEIVPTYLWSFYSGRVLKKTKFKVSVFMWDLNKTTGPVCLKKIETDFENLPRNLYWNNDDSISMTLGKKLLEIKTD